MPAVAAAVFAVVGPAFLALKLTTLGVFVAVAVFSPGALDFGPLVRPARSRGGALLDFRRLLRLVDDEGEGLLRDGPVFELVVLLLALRLREQGSRRDAALLGLALGLGWWTSPGVLVLAVLRSRGCCGDGEVLRLVPIALPGFLIGIAPWLA